MKQNVGRTPSILEIKLNLDVSNSLDRYNPGYHVNLW